MSTNKPPDGGQRVYRECLINAGMNRNYIITNLQDYVNHLSNTQIVTEMTIGVYENYSNAQ